MNDPLDKDPFDTSNNSGDNSGDTPPNKFQPPVNNIASRGKRFVASMIDGFAGLLVSFPVFSHFGVWETLQQNKEIPHSLANGLALFGVAMFFVLHGYLLFQYGQTIGKRVMGLAIVSLDGQKLPFPALIVNRYLPQWVVNFIPVIGPMLAMADVLFIFFNDQHRCVHDLIAKTKVIDLSIKVGSTPNSIIA